MTSQTHISWDDSKPKILSLMESARALKTLLLALLFSELMPLLASPFNSSAYSEAVSQEQIPDSANRCNLPPIFDVAMSFQITSNSNVFKYVFSAPLLRDQIEANTF